MVVWLSCFGACGVTVHHDESKSFRRSVHLRQREAKRDKKQEGLPVFPSRAYPHDFTSSHLPPPPKGSSTSHGTTAWQSMHRREEDTQDPDCVVP
jgi:hypothetical protein